MALCPHAKAVPAAAESVIGDEAENVAIIPTLGNPNIRRSSNSLVLRYSSVAIIWPSPILSPINKKIYLGVAFVSASAKQAMVNAIIIRLSILTIFSRCKIPYILFHISFGNIKELLNSLICYYYIYRNKNMDYS